MVLKEVKIIFLLVFIGMGVMVYALHYYNKKHTDEIINNLQTGEAFVSIVYDNESRGSGAYNWEVVYNYYVNGKLYTRTRCFDKRQYKKDNFNFTHFPVVFSSRRPDVSDILVTRKDSVIYGFLSRRKVKA